MFHLHSSWAIFPGARLRVGPRAWIRGRTESFVCRPGSHCTAGPQTDTDPRPPPSCPCPPATSTLGTFLMCLLFCLGTKLLSVLLCRYREPGSSFQAGRRAWRGGRHMPWARARPSSLSGAAWTAPSHSAVCSRRCLRITDNRILSFFWKEGDSDTGYNLGWILRSLCS